MPKQKELITAQQARKILGCTTENLRSLSKEGIISSVKVNTGKKTTIYYFEEEIQKRKSLSTKILIRAKRADECIRNSKRLYREALAKEKEAIERLKTSSNWKRRQERFGDLLLAVIRKLDGYSTLSLRDKKI